MFLFSKPCHVLNMFFLTFWPLKPYVLTWCLLIKNKRVMKMFLTFVDLKFRTVAD